jgi:cell wall-associated NlpC family hydrolase
MATIDPAVIANARQAETIKNLNMYNILNNIRIAANKTTFPYDGLVPQNIQFKKANVTINTINPTGAKPTQNIKPNKQFNKPDKHHTNNTQNVKTGGKHHSDEKHTDENHTDDSDSDNAHYHSDTAHNAAEIVFYA